MIEIFKTVIFQSLNFTNKVVGKLIVLQEERKSDEAKRRRKLFKFEKGKVC